MKMKQLLPSTFENVTFLSFLDFRFIANFVLSLVFKSCHVANKNWFSCTALLYLFAYNWNISVFLLQPVMDC